jgi:hypothetical protein
MTLLYRLMGVVALAGERASRVRLSFIPMNFGLLAALGFGFFLLSAAALEALVNGSEPHSIRIGELLSHPEGAQNYVRVVGDLYPDLGLERPASRRGGPGAAAPEKVWAPLLDAPHKRAILVDLEGGGPRKAGTVEVVGMVRRMDPELRRKLQSEGGKLGPVAVNTEYALEEGRHPGSAALLSLASLVSGVLLLLSIYTLASGYAVFRPSPRETVAPAAAIDPDEGIDLRVSGRFSLEDQHRRRFLDVGAGLGTLESGDLGFYPNSDASTRFHGVTTVGRAGMWTLHVPRGSFNDPEPGCLYVGLAERPAYRLRWRGPDGKPTAAILSFATEAERAAFAAGLAVQA